MGTHQLNSRSKNVKILDVHAQAAKFEKFPQFCFETVAYPSLLDKGKSNSRIELKCPETPESLDKHAHSGKVKYLDRFWFEQPFFQNI